MPMSPLEERLFKSLEKRRLESRLRILKASPPDSVDLSSNDFLSLSTNHEFKQDYYRMLTHKDLALGSTGSRLLDGNSTYAEDLEQNIASFHGAEAGLLTNSGFDANVSIFTYLPQSGDAIVYDELIHASVHDGMRQSRTKNRVSFKHNDLEDLSRVLDTFVIDSTTQNVFVAVESVYSMDGDLAPLLEIVNLIEARFPRKNAYLVVDEAHATGIYGDRGVGRVSALGIEKRVAIRLHTFGKAMACNGAIILCSPIIRQYLINYARPLIYTTFMSFPTLVAIENAYDWLKSGKTALLARKLDRLVGYLFHRLQTLREFTIRQSSDHSITLPSECPNSPIFAILTSHPRQLAAFCQNAGYIVRAVVPPTVPKGTERIRVCLHSGNDFGQIDNFVKCLSQWLIQFNTTKSPERTNHNPTREYEKSRKAEISYLSYNKIQPKL